MSVCSWCGRAFEPVNPTPDSYVMISAGKSICLSCADLYEVEEIKLHMDQIRANFDQEHLTTDSGTVLPFTIQSLTRGRRGKLFGRAVDSYGNCWSLKCDGNQAVLKPIGAA